MKEEKIECTEESMAIEAHVNCRFGSKTEKERGDVRNGRQGKAMNESKKAYEEMIQVNGIRILLKEEELVSQGWCGDDESTFSFGCLYSSTVKSFHDHFSIHLSIIVIH